MSVSEIDHHRIRARRVQFDWEQTPLHWIPGEPLTTHTINVLHLLLPAGEKWFCEVYRHALPSVTDERLREDVKGFIGQEAVHSRAHAAVLEHLAAQGVDTTRFVRLVEWGFGSVLGGRGFLKPKLSIIAAIEHFTYVLGRWVVDSPALDAAGADPTMLDLLRWHGAEEVEHRAVAFDLATHLGVRRPRRIASMIGVVFAMTVAWLVGTRLLVHADPTRPSRHGLFRGYLRASKRGLVPGPRLLAGAVPTYLRAGYHPSQEGGTEEALAYLATSPAARYAS